MPRIIMNYRRSWKRRFAQKHKHFTTLLQIVQIVVLIIITDLNTFAFNKSA